MDMNLSEHCPTLAAQGHIRKDLGVMKNAPLSEGNGVSPKR